MQGEQGVRQRQARGRGIETGWRTAAQRPARVFDVDPLRAGARPGEQLLGGRDVGVDLVILGDGGIAVGVVDLDRDHQPRHAKVGQPPRLAVGARPVELVLRREGVDVVE